MASTLKINTLTGVTTAGSIAVTAEGNSTATNLQQGLCKAWINMDAGQTTNDSFNVSSIADVGTGQHTINFNNDFANTRHVSSLHGKEDTGSSHNSSVDRMVGPSRVAADASLLKITGINLSGTITDLAEIFVSTHGDLA